ncbi:alpha/beta hydrolase [Uliginosibacterium sp. H1]|uniref:alpha/beta hydrolase n=1 Tax=Uliginosibacterium sp. H1 TaxID=3114757 RepID=UPI002E19F1E6|nr:alpha/beta hydrolase [Uliginosibacterium sp. H1]
MRAVRFLFTVLTTFGLAACTTPGPSYSSFDEYRTQTRALIEQRRAFLAKEGKDMQAELEWNSPQEWRPAGWRAVSASAAATPTRGVLLVHGLGDSPWSFHDLGQRLAERGFLVRTQVALLKRELDGHGQQGGQVWLGGFSTGANLVTEYALDDDAIAGLLLFSPAFRSDTDIDWLAPWVAWARPWLRERDPGRPEQSPVRYLITPTNGFSLFWRSSYAVRSRLADKPFDRPALLVTTANDSVVDVGFTLLAFQQSFTHPASRLVWYGDLPADVGTDRAPPRVLVRTDRLPERRISQFSHMGLLFAPDNPLYGEAGTLRLCWNGQAPDTVPRCEAGEEVWYSDWGYREDGKIHARLTWNPYFDWQLQVLESVLGAAHESVADAPRTEGGNTASARRGADTPAGGVSGGGAARSN